MTQREPKGEHRTYLVPPASITFTVYQEHKNRCEIHVEVYSGMHRFMHRRVEVFYDKFDEIPVIWLDASMRWLFWFAQFEAARRGTMPGKPRRLELAVPGWPAPDPLQGHHTEVGF
jgi:hypothetical protein